MSWAEFARACNNPMFVAMLMLSAYCIGHVIALAIIVVMEVKDRWRSKT